MCQEERKGIEEEEEGGGSNNADEQQGESRHNGSVGSNGSKTNDKQQNEKRHSWRLEMFEDQQVAFFLTKKDRQNFCFVLGCLLHSDH